MHYKKELSIGDKGRLDQLYTSLKQRSDSFAGYPCNTVFDYSELYPFFEFCINNVGDPFAQSNYQVNTHEFEREVLHWFARLYHLEEDFAGYTTSGGSEGNMYGLNVANKLYPSGLIYYSADTHYSVDKIVKLLNGTPVKIPSGVNGEMDYEQLAVALTKNKDKPAIIFANIGTTMTGAIDDVGRIQALLKDCHIEQHYIHCDAAFFGMILPFIDCDKKFRFSDGIDSVSISGHKFIGSPLPCGIALTRKAYIDKVSTHVEYVNIVDSTISGSRSGIAPLMMWYAIQRMGVAGFTARVQDCLQKANELVYRLTQAGIPAWVNACSPIVVIPRPCEAITKKWQLASYNNISHIITLPQMTEQRINLLCQDLLENRGASPVKSPLTVKRFGVREWIVAASMTLTSGILVSQFDLM
jgi:histidine decarboxylase